MQEPPEDASRLLELYETSPYAAFPGKLRRGGTFELTAADIRQGTVDVTTPVLSEIVFGTAIDQHDPFEIDFGDGWRRNTYTKGTVDVQPAFTTCSYRLPPMHLHFVAAPHAVVSERLQELDLTPSALDAVTGQFRTNPEAARLLRQTWQASAYLGTATNLLLDGLFLQLLATLLRATGDDRASRSVPAIGDRRIARVIDYVEDYIDEGLSVGELASVACVSVFHFSRCFGRAVGVSPHAYVMIRRTERAKAMLVASETALAEVAFACGFASQSHMTDVFRARVGMSPGQYRTEAAT